LDTSSDPEAGGKVPGGFRGAIRAALPRETFGDHLTILSGTGQNIAGLAVFVLASLGTNVLISRELGAPGLGVVTLASQFAFVAGAATRFGMDMATVRRVAIDVGKGEPGRVRGVMVRAVAIASVVSLAVGIAVFFGADGIAQAFGFQGGLQALTRFDVDTRRAFRAAALALPFVALCQVYLGGTRGLKIMRHTLSIYWVGQPVAWIALLVLGWSVSKSVSMSVLAYAGSWILATLAAALVWDRETRAFPPVPPGPGEARELIRYGAPRAPAALLSQLLFWTDYFVLSRYVTSAELGVYAAAVRVAQALVLFLIAVNYMFSPFVADLHARGERDRLDGLYKALARWTLAGTLPLLLMLVIVPGPVLLIFGAKFDTAVTPLRILLIGQMVNVAVGSVGFILIMVGRTGWDLTVYAGSFAVDLAVAFWLAPGLGAKGAAIAQAVTLAVANASRLYLVWRFVHIQPFNRHYARLAIPAAAGGAAMLVMHALLRNGSWPVDLVATGAVGTLAYVAVLLGAGLTPTERAAAGRILRARRGG
jgi:O-antigen/teichoic acid export membrane protein